MGAAGKPRADAVDQRIGADRERSQQRESHRAAIEPGEVAPAAQREEKHAARQQQDSGPCNDADALADETAGLRAR